MVYVAIRSDHPVVKYVRLALPLTDVNAQLATIGSATVLALVAALVAALVLSWLFSAPLARRVEAVAAVAQRYSAGDFSRPAHDYGEDELGAVARTLDAAAQELGRKLDDLSRDRARTEAILAGMVEGMLIVDRQGRVQLVNRAAQDMLRVTEQATGRPYVEVIRHPDIAALLGGGAAPRADGQPRSYAGTRRVAHLRGARGGRGLLGDGGAVLVLHDITDLRGAGQIRQDFVANVSHELRTPLTAIRGYVEALLDEPRRPRRARLPGHHRAAHGAHGAPGEGSAAAGAARRAAGAARARTLRACSGAFDAVLCGPDAERRAPGCSASRSTYARRRHADADAGQAARHPAQPRRERDELLAEPQSDIRLSAEGATARPVHVVVSDSGPGIPPNDLGARVRALLSRGQVALGNGRHRPGPLDRQAPGRAARRDRCRSSTGRRGRRGLHRDFAGPESRPRAARTLARTDSGPRVVPFRGQIPVV